MFRAIAIAATLLLAACHGRPELEDYAEDGPPLVLEEYFAGDLTAWGVFQDRFGDVRRQFVVDLEGTWDGTTLTLVEDFVYDDGEEEQRIWRLTKSGPDTWQGSAAGVIGPATGEIAGNAFNWTYTIDLPIGDGETMVVSFDDWMWLQDEETLFNLAYMSRYGIEIGRVMIFFRKDTP
ncbi:MAG: DUF3833 domain-containing protein [Pseudomonadota bacterium]